MSSTDLTPGLCRSRLGCLQFGDLRRDLAVALYSARGASTLPQIEEWETMSFRRAGKLLGWGTAVAMVGALVMTPAYAEDSRIRTFNDANPGFTSSSWVDNQTDSVNTVIKWSDCWKTNGTKVTSIEVKLVDQWGILPDATVGDYRTIKGVCGSSTWYKNSADYTLRDSSFYWEFGAINGNWNLHYLNGTSKATY